MAEKEFSFTPTTGAVYGFFFAGLVTLLSVFIVGLDPDEELGRRLLGTACFVGGGLGFLAGRLGRP